VLHLFHRVSYPEDLDERISFLPNNLAAWDENIKECLKLSRRFIKWRYPTGDTVLSALFYLLTQKDPTKRSSIHLIYGYLGVLIRKFRGQSFDIKLFESGVTELPFQTLDDAFWGSREQPSLFTEELKLAENIPPFLEAAGYFMSNSQCLFITQNEYIGIGPRAVRPDDKIFIPFGCDVPLVIRFTGKKYIVIGSCLIYGLKKGKIMEKLERGDIEPEELEFI
jgi:hypothetical protein